MYVLKQVTEIVQIDLIKILNINFKHSHEYIYIYHNLLGVLYWFYEYNWMND